MKSRKISNGNTEWAYCNIGHKEDPFGKEESEELGFLYSILKTSLIFGMKNCWDHWLYIGNIYNYSYGFYKFVCLTWFSLMYVKFNIIYI